MLEELALQSTAATWQEQARLQAPICPQYGTPLDERRTHPRTLLTHGGQVLILERSYAVCPTCNSGLFPLDDELGLLPGQLSPRLQEGLVRLSTHIASFAKAAAEFAFWSQITLARSTARRLTEAAAAGQGQGRRGRPIGGLVEQRTSAHRPARSRSGSSGQRCYGHHPPGGHPSLETALEHPAPARTGLDRLNFKTMLHTQQIPGTDRADCAEA